MNRKDNLQQYVINMLRRRLKDGQLERGQKLPTLRNLANEFKVSTMTVRQAVGTLEKEGYLYRIPSVGSFVRSVGPYKTSTKEMVAFAGADLRSTFEMDITRGIEKACQQRGWSMQILDSQLDIELEARNMMRLPETGSRGAIILPICLDKSIETLFKLQQTKLPFVLIDRSPLGINADIVESNHEQGAYLATKYLLAKGHSKILILVPLPIILPVQLRIRGYQRALMKAGLEPQPDWNIGVDPKLNVIGVKENRRWYGGYKTILPILQQTKPPLAVFALDNTTGWGVYQACRELGLRIPEDVSVICFDDSELALGMVPPMTTVAQRTDEIGRIAVDMLERRFQQGDDRKEDRLHTSTRVIVDVDLIERDSVADINGV